MALADLMTRKANKTPLANAGVMAMRLSKDKELLEISGTGGLLADLLKGEHEVLLGIIEKVLGNGLPAEARLDGMEENQNLWLVCIHEGQTLLVVARDTTMPDKVAGALIHSRVMMKDLLDSATDLAFEVDENGLFSFVSPSIFLGRVTEEWIGRQASDAFWGDQLTPRNDPFRSQADTSLKDVAYFNASGIKQYLSVTIRHIKSEGAVSRGYRGTVRIVTEDVRKQQASKREKLRLSLQERLMRILTTAESSDELLGKAVDEVRDLFRADAVFIFKSFEGEFIPVASEKCEDVEIDLDQITGQSSTCEPETVLFIDDGARRHMAVPFHKGDQIEGLVLVSRDTMVHPWNEQETAFLLAIGSILAAAKEKAALFDKLYRLSGQDELTLLLNRRAFAEEVNKRLLHQKRTGQSGCLMFIDLDHFKEVNDNLGHQSGDEALKLVSENIRKIIRPIDFAGRYGGDEFVIWIENIDAQIVAAKARYLIDSMEAIRAQLGDKSLKLSMSIGICKSDPQSDINFAGLTQKADGALYRVKRAGRGHIAFSEQTEIINFKDRVKVV